MILLKSIEHNWVLNTNSLESKLRKKWTRDKFKRIPGKLKNSYTSKNGKILERFKF